VKHFLSVFFLLLTLWGKAQNQYKPFEYILKPERVIFYNVENLFDTVDNPETNDAEYLPTSKSQWNTAKYQTKLKHTSETLAALVDTVQPLVIGLSEIENIQVLEDLLAQPALKKFNLGIVHRDSPDERGIDCALLFNKDVLNESFSAFIPINFPFDTADKTREIVYLKGYINEGEPIWFFVNHWPSRLGGKEKSDVKRAYVAQVLKDKIENIYLGEKYARVVVMGDFNDNPNDSTLSILTEAKKNSRAEPMVNMMKPLAQQNQFSLRYKEENDIFDQFIVSENLLDKKNPYYLRLNGAHIFNPPFLLFNHPKYGLVPNRTYAGGKWVGGYSDHLPVYFDIVFK
jgi:hypothetical protein